MPIGNMVRFDSGTFAGTIDYDFFIGPIKLSNTEKEFNYIIDMDSKPEKVYVIINVSRNKNVEPKWRLWLNDFSLTKEFKPNIEVEDGTNKLDTIIYDISPLVKQGKNELLISYKGIQEITIESIGHVVFYKAEKFETRYDLNAGALILRPGEELKFTCHGECYFIAKNGGKDSKLLIDDYQIVGDNEPQEVKMNKQGDVFVRFMSPNNSKSLAYIYSFYSISYIIPLILLDINAQINQDGIEVNIKNLSEISLDKVIVNVLFNGLSISYKVFNDIKVSDSIALKVPLQSNRKGNILIRTVGVKSGFRKTFDKLLTL